MAKFIGKKVLWALVTIVVIAVFIHGMMASSPGHTLDYIMLSPEYQEMFQNWYGNLNLFERFNYWGFRAPGMQRAISTWLSIVSFG